jgi:hypothetical protein
MEKREDKEGDDRHDRDRRQNAAHDISEHR